MFFEKPITIKQRHLRELYISFFNLKKGVVSSFITFRMMNLKVHESFEMTSIVTRKLVRRTYTYIVGTDSKEEKLVSIRTETEKHYVAYEMLFSSHTKNCFYLVESMVMYNGLTTKT